MHDPKRESARWLTSAEEDLAYARHATSGGFAAPACFHAQQAAEKAVKAVHYARGARAVLGHSARSLIEALDPPTGALDAALDAARELDLFYVPTRYPNGLDSGTPGIAFAAAQAERAIGLAEAVVLAARAAAASSDKEGRE